jgi:hypothetical protein
MNRFIAITAVFVIIAGFTFANSSRDNKKLETWLQENSKYESPIVVTAQAPGLGEDIIITVKYLYDGSTQQLSMDNWRHLGNIIGRRVTVQRLTDIHDVSGIIGGVNPTGLPSEVSAPVYYIFTGVNK